MSIVQTSTTLASMLDQPTAASSSSTAPLSTTTTSFQQVMNTAAAVETPPELTALQLLFRCPTATPSITTPASTTGSTTPAPVNPSSGTDSGIAAPPDIPLDPSPAAPWPTTVIQPHPTPALAGQAKSAVLAALQKEGIDPSKVKISYWEELVTYPGGSYTNKNITVQTASGQKIDLDAAYMARCPWLAASAVKELDQVIT